jgi:hypothetical protein
MSFLRRKKKKLEVFNCFQAQKKSKLQVRFTRLKRKGTNPTPYFAFRVIFALQISLEFNYIISISNKFVVLC